jgi:hypothetical protein
MWYLIRYPMGHPMGFPMGNPNTITYEDVREWKSKPSFGQKAKPRGSNSFIASEPQQ